MINKNTVKLNTGYSLPLVGLGAWRTTELSDVRNVIETAIDLGYRHIDTAYNYKNEENIGIVLEDLIIRGVINREELFITSKLWSACHEDPEKYFLESLHNLKLEYLDLYLIHWPVTIKTKNGKELKTKDGVYETQPFDAVGLWKKMEAIYKTGKVRSIGVSNFGTENLQLVLDSCEIVPAANQIEIHPYCQQEEIISLCRKNGIVPIAYSPLGSYAEDTGVKPLSEDPVIQSIANSYGVPPSKVLINFLTQQQIPAVPKSSNPKHLQTNLEMLELTEEDMKKLCSIKKKHKFRDPVFMGPDRYK